MRSEQAMLDLILETARQDERIRAVMLNGSRANPYAPHDMFQDFDIVYFVSDVAPFRRNLAWIERFGERMVLQLPDDMPEPQPDDGRGYTYLMQFMDGNRIDLTLWPLAQAAELEPDSLSVLLLDKDGSLPALPPANESGYIPQPPTAKQFADCCNEFWWVCPYVAKGLWRQEILYARYMLDTVIRPQLMKMLAWHIGVQTQFAVNPGKFGKHYKQHLPAEMWAQLEATFAGPGYPAAWQAVFAMCELFRVAGGTVGQHFGYPYPHDDDKRVSAHLRYVQALPGDAQTMYE